LGDRECSAEAEKREGNAAGSADARVAPVKAAVTVDDADNGGGGGDGAVSAAGHDL
jgi:hypothetical protein